MGLLRDAYAALRLRGAHDADLRMRCAGQSVVIVKMGERQRVYDVTICINGPSSRVDDDHVESETITSVLVKIDAAKYPQINLSSVLPSSPLPSATSPLFVISP